METPEPQAPASQPPVVQIPQPERQWALFSHLSAFAGFLIPLGNVLGPLVMFLIKKEEFPFGSAQAKEALNFNISCLIYAIISFVLMIVVIGFILLPALGIFWLVVTIIAAIKANDGIAYRYPLCIRMVG